MTDDDAALTALRGAADQRMALIETTITDGLLVDAAAQLDAHSPTDAWGVLALKLRNDATPSLLAEMLSRLAIMVVTERAGRT